ncbi:hypothetical protein DFJ74DRAFT_711588 [Hyaloraphidium curvatum]|nr:hypothetical protein DFJ74DRAFT_711588 [Hyaloraphidium curvatum]
MDGTHASPGVLPPRIAFSAAEWIAIVPAPLSTADDLGEAASADPAAELRAERPLTRVALLHELKGTGPTLLLTRMQFAFAPLAKLAVPRGAMGLFLAPCFAAGAYVFNDGRFGERQLALGTVGLVLAFGMVFATFLGPTFYPAVRRPRGLGDGGGKQDASSHIWAGIARWLQLVRTPAVAEDGAPDPAAVTAGLLEHDPSDTLCPCPRPGCSGGIPVLAGRLHLLELSVRTISGTLVIDLFVAWTSVITFRGPFFASWWGPLLFSLSVASSIAWYGVNNLLRYPGNLASLDLSRRVVRRAMRSALANLVARYRTALTSSDFDEPAQLLGDEPYQQLHLAIAGSWARRYDLFVGIAPAFATMAFLMPGTMAVSNILGGYCIPFAAIFNFLFLVHFVLTDLVNIATSNDQVNDLARLYSSARRDLRLLAVSSLRASPSPAQSAAMAGLRAHEALLSSFLEIDAAKTRMWGSAVGFGTVRTVLATMATALAALWTILRAAGVGFTMETVCPVPAA